MIFVVDFQMHMHAGTFDVDSGNSLKEFSLHNAMMFVFEVFW